MKHWVHFQHRKKKSLEGRKRKLPLVYLQLAQVSSTTLVEGVNALLVD
jgi:hypothetical protein